MKNAKKITPFILLSVICIIISVYALFDNGQVPKERSGTNIPWIMPLLLLVGAFVAFGADRLVKKYTPELKEVWVVEGVMVAFIVFYIIFLK